VQAAVPLALFLYQSAIDEGVCLTSEKYIKAVMDRAATGKIPKCAFQPFSAEVYPVVLKELATNEFWKSVTANRTLRKNRSDEDEKANQRI